MNDADDLEGFLFHVKPCKALIYLDECEESYASEVRKEIDATYSHTVRILKNLEQLGLIEYLELDGRKKPCKLTGEGREVAESLTNTMRTVE